MSQNYDQLRLKNSIQKQHYSIKSTQCLLWFHEEHCIRSSHYRLGTKNTWNHIFTQYNQMHKQSLSHWRSKSTTKRNEISIEQEKWGREKLILKILVTKICIFDILQSLHYSLNLKPAKKHLKYSFRFINCGMVEKFCLWRGYLDWNWVIK